MPTLVRDTDLLPFIRAIAAAPTDPLPKMILADFLEEHGDDGASVMRWAGNVNKYPEESGIMKRPQWRAGRYPLWLEEQPGNFISRALVRRMTRTISPLFVRGEIQGAKSFKDVAAALKALLRAARKCAADNVDPFGEE